MPEPLETRRRFDPSMFITYCWSQVRPSRVDWKMRRLPSALKYASAFSPPKVICLTLARCVSPLSVVLAWGFVAARCVHSYIHLGSNDVSRRFFIYFLSLLFLTGLWGALLVSLLRSAT